VAAIGLTTGAGYYSAAAIATLLVIVSLWPLRIVAHRVMVRIRPETDRLLAQLPAGESPAPLIVALEEQGAQLRALEIGHEADRRTVRLDVALPPRSDAPAIVAKLSELEGILEIRWAD
jgi:uncharacterized membrane protein YhiD involved in acid resistance